MYLQLQLHQILIELSIIFELNRSYVIYFDCGRSVQRKECYRVRDEERERESYVILKNIEQWRILRDCVPINRKPLSNITYHSHLKVAVTPVTVN